MLIFFAFLTLSITAGSTYDFKDGSFNELILSSFIDLNDQYENLQQEQEFRFKRSTDEEEHNHDHDHDHHGCKWGKGRGGGVKCCNDKPMDSKVLENYRSMKRECFKNFYGNAEFHFDPFTCEKLEELKSKIICISECIGHKLQILDDNGDVIGDEFVKHIKEKFSVSADSDSDPDSAWKLNITEDIVEKCLKESEKLEHSDGESSSTATTTTAADAGYKCNSNFIKVAHCVWAEFVKACPKELQIESPRCLKLRERLESHEDVINKSFYLKHFHFHDDKKK